MRRRKDRVDENQSEIVEELRKLPAIEVEVGHDDLLVGYRGKTYWFEVKDPAKTLKKDGAPKKGALKPSQEKLLKTWTGHYKIVFTAGEILEEIEWEKQKK